MAGKIISLTAVIAALVLTPLQLAIINKVKAGFAGRQGPCWRQPYTDIYKLLRKSTTYSRTTTWIFRAGPIVSLACTVLALSVVPLGAEPALMAFPGDLVFLAYLFGLGRFLTVIAALDTGSSFEGMGASREVTFSALAEPAFFLGLAATARLTQTTSLSAIVAGLTPDTWRLASPVLALVAAGLFVVFLTENARMPVDDPTTHLELTMIHEVMVLDHSGPELGAIAYGSALKMWVLGAILVGIINPVHTAWPLVNLIVAVAELAGLAVVVGVVESIMARLRLVRIPQLLAGATGVCALALILALR